MMLFIAYLATVFTLLGVSTYLMVSVVRQSEAALDQRADHAKCMALISSVVSDRVVAAAFREAASRWDSVEEQGHLKQLARECYKPGGPSMPSIWLNAEADRIDPFFEKTAQ